MGRKHSKKSRASQETERLRLRLQHAEDTLHAIRAGQVDALVVETNSGEQIYTLQSADTPYRILIETMSEGALSLTSEGVVLYANQQVADMLKAPLETFIGSDFRRFIPGNGMRAFESLLKEGIQHRTRVEMSLQFGKTKFIPVVLSCSPLEISGRPCLCVVVTDLTETTMTNQKLRAEIAERKRLEGEVVKIAERDQRLLGESLHDGLGQQLAGIAMLSQTVANSLILQSHPRADDAQVVASILENTIQATRRMARGLYPIELERSGIFIALEELADRTEATAKVRCRVTRHRGLRFPESAGIHLYRIAQEAISNALKHGKCKNISIKCVMFRGKPALIIESDGLNYEAPKNGSRGMGMHLFQYRANLIGAEITVTPGAKGGCRVECLFFKAS